MNTNNNKVWVAVIAIIAILVLGFIWWGMKDQANIGDEISEVPLTQTFDSSVSDGLINIKYLSTDFGMATTVNQILLPPSVVSPCNGAFEYCFYYSTTTYNGTNFESAGISVSKRPDLKTESTCLNTPPAGYDASVLPDARKPQTGFSTSVFKNVGDSGAGHIVTANVYRLFNTQSSSCYELLEKIAYTQFGNYPSGKIIEFTTTNREALMARLENIVDNISIKGSTVGIFP